MHLCDANGIAGYDGGYRKYCMLALLQKPSDKAVQVRCHAMEICDQLFQRSHLFRWLTTQHLPQILEHAVGTKASRPLPGPPNVATRLHEKALESIDQWADQYGAYYQQVQAEDIVWRVCLVQEA